MTLRLYFLNENTSAHYIHCFSHQLQLTLMIVVKSHVHIALLFPIMSSVMDIINVSCRRRDQVWELQCEKALNALQSKKNKNKNKKFITK